MNLLSILKWVITIWMLVITPATCNIILDLNKPTQYGKFVEQVRNEIKHPTMKFFDIPIIKAETPTQRFFYIDIKVNKNKDKPAISVTLQLRISDLYVVAYRDKDAAGRYRYFYFTSVNIRVQDVFPGDPNVQPEPMKCNHNYASIEGTAKKEIKNLEFKIPNLEDVMRNAYGKSTTLSDFPKKQALFLLHSIVMTSEATRFKYIEQKTVKKQNSDVKVASLVKEWDKISVQIIGADETTGKFRNTIQLQIAESPNQFQELAYVRDIKADMGILKYY